jgi:hypothetical protein
MRETVRTLVGQRGRFEIADGRVTMEAADPPPSLYVRQPEHPPLGESESVAALALTGDGVSARVELTAADAEELVDALGEVLDR